MNNFIWSEVKNKQQNYGINIEFCLSDNYQVLN